MWGYRELVKILFITDLKNRYQNTTLGFFWSILSPFFLAMVLYAVFRHVFPHDENFAINLLVGIMAWRFFHYGTTAALNSVVEKTSLVTKVFLPRQILVLSKSLSSLVSSMLEFLVLVPVIFVLLRHIPVTMLLFPVIHVLYFCLIFGIGLFLSALFVYFRDINQIWEVLLNVLFFTSPIIYPLSQVPDTLMPYYMFNPITRLITIYRDVMIAGKLPSIDSLIVVISFCAIALLVGSFTFGKLQRRFAEVI